LGGFIHGYFLDNYLVQISLLMTLKAIIYVVCFRQRRCYTYKIGAISTRMYFCVGFFYDCILLAAYIIDSTDYSNVLFWIEIGLIGSLLVSVILKLISAILFYSDTKFMVYQRI
jgi:hypothetical protein